MYKYMKSLLYIFISLLIFNIILSIIYYFSNITNLNIIKLITTSISFFIGGLYIGNKSNKKGYLEGIKIGLIAIILLFIISYLALDKSITINKLIYYLIILSSTILGSIFGINKRKNLN